jgi:hypothetical protein
MAAVYYFGAISDRKRAGLEDYLRKENRRVRAVERTPSSILMAKVGLAENETLRASFRSRHIRRGVHSMYTLHPMAVGHLYQLLEPAVDGL